MASAECIFLIDFSSFDEILVHLKLQTCFVLPGLFSDELECILKIFSVCTDTIKSNKTIKLYCTHSDINSESYFHTPPIDLTN